MKQTKKRDVERMKTSTFDNGRFNGVSVEHDKDNKMVRSILVACIAAGTIQFDRIKIECFLLLLLESKQQQQKKVT